MGQHIEYLPVMDNKFQSTHPVRGGTYDFQPDEVFCIISIHPPREGWDANRTHIGIEICISIHPPREGWDWRTSESRQSSTKFQSTHPVRGGTSPEKYVALYGGISIHPPREGWDFVFLHDVRCIDISIHPPREGWDRFIP